MISKRKRIANFGPVLTAAVFMLCLRQIAPVAAPAQERYVVVGGALTEIAYALGRQDAIVGVDATSLFPPQALKDKANVGYFRALSAEGVLSLRPTRILAVEGAGPPATLDALTASGASVQRVADQPTPDGVAQKILAVGAALDAAKGAEALAAEARARFAALEARRQSIATPKRALFVLAVQNGRLLCGGAGTAADAMLRLAGAVNVAGFDGYKAITEEALVAAAPEAIVGMARDGAAVAEAIKAAPAVARTPAAQRQAIFEMDSLYLLGFGPRAPEAAAELMTRFYPAGGTDAR
ncbi:iron complex transport system substrate-binding protein [Rhodoblastus sphagnicola]|nr:ABC transporter substrate-binding protein [Rhodoblastus sphagnicola]MBB4200150.1 iron complex transport system substrate-binding protein [Rhodoblastus sphagnicola]